MHSEFVYILRAGDYFKIGKTIDFSKRIAQLKIQLPFEVELFKVINTNDSAKLEKHFHRIYRKLRANGEWFKLTPHDAIMLSLHPCSVDYSNIEQFNQAWDATLKVINEAFEQKARDEALEELIEQESTAIFSDFPDNWGGALMSDYLAYECPHVPDPEDMEWVVSDDTEE